MVQFQQRITHDTAPAIRVEHEVRYGSVAPLVATAPAWVDLGCGNGLAARAALTQGRPPKIALIDIDEVAVNEAALAVGEEATAIVADLSQEEGLRIAHAAIDDAAVVTCFESVEHLPVFVGLIELLVEAAELRSVTAVLSVPNDVFSGVDNPHHVTTWGEGAVDELRGLLPDRHVVASQIALAGSTIAFAGAPSRYSVEVATAGANEAPTHFVIAFGPRVGELAWSAAAAPVAAREQRAWERQRAADLAYYQQWDVQLRRDLREQIERVNEFRRYIHELETRLGLPLSGT